MRCVGAMYMRVPSVVGVQNFVPSGVMNWFSKVRYTSIKLVFRYCAEDVAGQ